MRSQQFYFQFPTSRVEIPLPNGLSTVVRIQQESVATARATFICHGYEIKMPDGLVIKNITNCYDVEPVFNSENKCCVLDWTCSYEIWYNGQEIASLINPRDWDPLLILRPSEERFWNIFF